jgi:hypothetical protein
MKYKHILHTSATSITYGFKFTNKNAVNEELPVFLHMKYVMAYISVGQCRACFLSYSHFLHLQGSD